MIVEEFEKMVKNEIDAPLEDRKILAEKMFDVLLEFYEAERYDICISLLLLITSLKCPLRNLNIMRAKLQTFGKLGGEDECYREELLFFPDNEEAKMLLEKYNSTVGEKSYS